MTTGERLAYSFAVTLLLCHAAGATAPAGSVPTSIDYEGQVTDSSGAPLTGSEAMTFSVYDVASGGTALWSVTQTVQASNGSFSTALPIPVSVLGTPSQLYLGTAVNGGAEMTPRVSLLSVPYALIAKNLEDGAQVSSFTVTGTLSAGGPATIGGASFSGTPYVTLQADVTAGGASTKGVTSHSIFGPYNSATGDVGALYIGAGQSANGSRNDIVLYNYGCGGGTCNVPQVTVSADTTSIGGAMTALAGSGRVGIGTGSPAYKLDVQGGQINASGGLCIAGVCQTTWGGAGGSLLSSTNAWTAPQSFLDGVTLPSGELGIGQQSDPTAYLRLGMDSSYQQFLANNAYWNGSAYDYVYTGGYGGLASRVSQSNGGIGFDTASGGVNPISWTNRLSIANGGAVGIGTASPTAKLTVLANSPSTSTFEGSPSMFDITTGSNGQSLYLSYDGGNDVGFIEASKSGALEPLSLQPRGGAVGIGTIAPATTLDVDGSAQFGSVAKSTFSAAGALTFAPGYAPGAAQDAATKGYVDAQVSSSVQPFKLVDVSRYATAGSGTASNPWTGWDTAIAWAGGTTYIFPAGVYAYTKAPNWAFSDIHLRGEGTAVLQFNGSGNAVVFDAHSFPAPINNASLENVTISGNSAATDGLYLASVQHSIFRNVHIRNVASAGLYTYFAVANLFEHIVVSANEGVMTPTPAVGIVFSGFATASGRFQTTASTVIDPIIEGVKTTGIELDESADNIFIAGTSEGIGEISPSPCVGQGTGLLIGADSARDKFIGMDLECNGNDIVDSGSHESFEDVLAMDAAQIQAGQGNRLTGGQYNALTVGGGASETLLIGLQYGQAGGVLTDAGVNTRKEQVRNAQTNLLDGDAVPNSVGIGTEAPSDKLTVSGSGAAIGVTGAGAQPLELIAGTSLPVLKWYGSADLTFGNDPNVGDFGNGAAGAALMSLSPAGQLGLGLSNPVHTLGVQGTIGASGQITANTTPDLAETIAGPDDVAAADVVRADPDHRERVVLASRPYDAGMLGVISDGSSSFMINAYGGKEGAKLTGKPLVLAGRVPVKVSLENGPIRIGDLLTSSSKPGYAMRATRPGPTVGVALEAFDGESGPEGKVLCFVHVGGDTSALVEQLGALQAQVQRLARRLDQLDGRSARR